MLQPISRKDFFEQFQIMSELSRSQYSETYLCKYRNDPLNHYVAKCFRKDKINNMGEFIKAINDVQLLKLSFMVPYEFVADDEDQHIILIRKYVNMKPINDLSPGEFQMSIVWRHIFQCYANLHDKGIGGVLVKPGNILLFSNSLVVLVDFYPIPSPPFTGTIIPDCRSLQYLAPEFFTNDFPISPKSDIWSLGVIMITSYGYEMPWKTWNLFSMIKYITATKFEIPASLPPQLRDILSKMLVKDPSLRYSASQLIRSQTRSIGSSQLDIIVRPKRNSDTQIGSMVRLNPNLLQKLSVASRTSKIYPLPTPIRADSERLSRLTSPKASQSFISKGSENHKIIDNILTFS